MSDLSDAQNNLVKSIAQENDFVNYDIEVKSGTIKGDNYMGIINTIQIRDRDQPDSELNLVMKYAATDEKLREQVPIRKAYEREIYMYGTIFPELKAFQDARHVTCQFHETAPYLGGILAEGQECLILQNLRNTGYQLWNRLEPMNARHVSQVLEAYGKFHGLSLALQALQPARYKQFEQNLDHIFDMKKTHLEIKANVLKLSKNALPAVAGNDKATIALDSYADELFRFYKTRPTKIKYSAILHGDCWCNNMMFKYEDEEDPSKPTSVCLLDWQLSRTGTVVDDLAYFLCTCASKEILDEWETYLRIYHSSVSQILQECGLDSEQIIPFDGLVEEWKYHLKGGLFWALLVLKVMVSDVEDAPDISGGAQEGKTIIESLAGAASNQSKYLKRIADVVVFMTDNDYL